MIETILSPGFVLLFCFVVALGSLIPAILSKIVMIGVFRHETSFGLILIMMVATAFLCVLALAWLGLLEEDRFDALPGLPTALLTFAAYAMQLALLSMFVPDENGDTIAMWKWAVVLILQYVIFVALAIAIALFLGMASATAAPLIPAPEVPYGN